MSVLITGGAGYIGSVTASLLAEHGYEVRILDAFLYDNYYVVEALKERGIKDFIRGDVRDEEVLLKAMKDADAIIHLAALVGAPACKKDPTFTVEVNYEATKRIGDLCQKLDIDRLVFASSTSVYGNVGGDKYVDEEGPCRPLSLYAETKLMSEKYLLEKSREEGLPVCCLRVATNYGPSLRPRLDLAVNHFVYRALKHEEIVVHGGGQWRPFINTYDTARAYQVVLEAPLGRIKGEVYNVGSTQENYRIIDVAEMVKELVPDVRIKVATKLKDPRSYKVSFEKIKERLGFTTNKTLKEGIRELMDFIRNIPNPEDKRYYNYLP